MSVIRGAGCVQLVKETLMSHNQHGGKDEVEVCTGRNFRVFIQPENHLARPSPMFNFKCITRARLKPHFLLFQPK
jgi:hypothetical protein